MWPAIMGFARVYAPYIMWPAAAVIGLIGYNIESIVRKDGIFNTPWKQKSIQQERDERALDEMKLEKSSEVDKLKDRKNIPKTILGRND